MKQFKPEQIKTTLKDGTIVLKEGVRLQQGNVRYDFDFANGSWDIKTEDEDELFNNEAFSKDKLKKYRDEILDEFRDCDEC